jgi:lysophospholipase L1-like esterase
MKMTIIVDVLCCPLIINFYNMKKIIVIIAFVLCQLSVSAQPAPGMDFSKAFKAGMDRRAGIFEIMPARTNGCIEFAGGSIMEDCEWSELFKNPKIINRGIDGNTTVDVLSRMNELTRHKPAKVFLEIGTSDLGNGVPADTIAGNIGKIVQLFLKANPKTELYILSILPAAPAGPNPMPGMGKFKKEDILALNNLLKSFCVKNKITYIDLFSSFVADDGVTLNTKFGNSNSKLSGSGYLFLKDIITTYVND